MTAQVVDPLRLFRYFPAFGKKQGKIYNILLLQKKN
jgi:hypothetical protein